MAHSHFEELELGGNVLAPLEYGHLSQSLPTSNIFQSYEPQTALSTINEENESEISTTLTTAQCETYEEDNPSIIDVEDHSNTNMSKQSKTFSIDTDASSYRCFKEIVMSSSSIFQNPFYFFPDLEDPGIQEAFETEEQKTIDDNGCQLYKDMCKEMEIYPISKVYKSLGTQELNLKFYVPFEKQMKAICKVLENNKFIQELNLQDNWLSVESCRYLADVLEMNTTLKILKMKECRIGPEGMAALSDALEMSYIQELDLSFNSLGNEGLKEAKTALSVNTNLTKLNLGHNEFTEDAAVHIHDILTEALRLVELDLSWNCFNTPKCMKKLCQGLLENTSLERLKVAWNGIATEQTVFPFVRYLKKNTSLKFLDMSNNLIGGDSLEILMKGVSESNSLEQFKIGNNVFSPRDAFYCAEVLAKPSEKPLNLIDMENMVVQKRFLKLLEKIKQQGNNVIYGAVLTDYEINGPYLPKVLFGRCKYLGIKPKKKKKRVDFGQFVLSLPEDPISSEVFQEALADKKLNNLLDSDLIAAVQNHYMIKKTRKIDCSQLVSDYMVLYPDTTLETPKKKKPQKEKKKKPQRVTKPSNINKKKAPNTSIPQEEVVRFDLPEAHIVSQQSIGGAATVTTITEKKLSFDQSERRESKSSQDKPITKQGSRSISKMSLSKGSLTETSSTKLKQKRHVSYGDVQERHASYGDVQEKQETETSAVETKESEGTTLNASGVFIMESANAD